MNPTLIDNYNKFLICLDKNESHHKKEYEEEKEEYENEKEEKDEKDEKDDLKKVCQNVLEKILKQIQNEYKSNNFDSSYFTGKSYIDNLAGKIEINDPNYYRDIDIKYSSKKNFKHINKENVKIKETINIVTEVNDISDILNLIEKYKYDPLISYNLNLKALHNIKEPLEELNNMVGMKELKNNIVEQILYFIQDLHKNKNLSGEFCNTVIYGPPGTGKTEIAKLMGNIYGKIGILEKGSFKKVTRSDLIAGYLGQTAIKTRDVIKEAIGGVLFIDEAYSLGNVDKKDSFSKECIDTLCEALSDNKENLMVIIAGYENELKECFFNYNQGLESRFTWRFKIDNYTAEDLYNIFVKKVNDIGWSIHENTIIKIEWFEKNKEYFKFYGRDIEVLLSKVKISHSKRVFCKPELEKKKITLEDLNTGLESYLKNNEMKNQKENEYFKKQLYSSIYC